MTDGGGPVSDREAGDRILRLAAGVRSGDTRAIGRAISEVERDSAAGRRIVAALAAIRIQRQGPDDAAHEHALNLRAFLARTDLLDKGEVGDGAGRRRPASPCSIAFDMHLRGDVAVERRTLLHAQRQAGD